MGILYDFMNKGITDDEINICNKEMCLLANKVTEVLEENISGISIKPNNGIYEVKIKKEDLNIITVIYSTENGTVLPKDGKDTLDAVLFCKSIKGQLYNTIRLLSRIKHRQSSITCRLGDDPYAYVYGDSLTLVVKSFNEINKLNKLVIKDTNVREYVKLGL